MLMLQPSRRLLDEEQAFAQKLLTHVHESAEAQTRARTCTHEAQELSETNLTTRAAHRALSQSN